MSTELAVIDKQKIQALRMLAGEVERSSVNIPKIAIDYRMKVDKKTNPNYGGFTITGSEKNEDQKSTPRKKRRGGGSSSEENSISMKLCQRVYNRDIFLISFYEILTRFRSPRSTGRKVRS